MARQLRIEFAGALYHVTSRGDRQEEIYLNDKDRRLFLSEFYVVCKRFNWMVHSYCLMDNHYHLLIETPDGNLSKGMRQLNGVYTQKFNRENKRVGHVFQGRYKSILVQKEAYLLELSRYIVLNPVRARMVRSAKDWPWSSYRATAGLSRAERFLETDWVLSSFHSRKTKAIEAYRKFVSEGKGQPRPWDKLKNQIFLGDDSFVEDMQCKISPDQTLTGVPSIQKRSVPKSLKYYEDKFPNRNDAIVAAYLSGGYSLAEVGKYFSLSFSHVGRIVNDK